MFKPSTVRSVSSLARLPLRFRSRLVRHESNVPVRRVRFKQPILTWRRAATFGLYTTAFCAYGYYLLPVVDAIEDVEGEAEDRHKARHAPAGPKRASAAGDEEEDDNDEETREYDEDSIFIPLGWARLVPRRFYRGSDPEWVEFKKLSQDTKRHAAMQLQLVSAIRSQMANDPRLTRRLGQIDMTAGRFWLDISFPDGPPQEYERSGLEITDDYIAWTTRPVSQENYHRLHRLIFPSAAFNSIYATSRYLFKLQVLRLKQFFGLAPQPEERLQQLRQQLELLQKAVNSGAAKGKPHPPTNPSTNPTSERSTAAPTPAGVPADAASAADQQKALLSRIPTLPDGNFPIALSIFASTLARSWTPLTVEPPRGTVVVSGLVEVRGSRAKCTMDVVAAYDPKTDQYVAVKGAVRRIQSKRQAPKGGP